MIMTKKRQFFRSLKFRTFRLISSHSEKKTPEEKSLGKLFDTRDYIKLCNK